MLHYHLKLNNVLRIVMLEFEKFLDYKEASSYIGFSKSKLVRWVRKGAFPSPLRAKSEYFLGWTKSQIIKWQQALMQKDI